MDPLVFPRSLSIGLANDVSKLYMINASGRLSFLNYSLGSPGITNVGVVQTLGPVVIIQYVDSKYFSGIRDDWLKTAQLFDILFLILTSRILFQVHLLFPLTH